MLSANRDEDYSDDEVIITTSHDSDASDYVTDSEEESEDDEEFADEDLSTAILNEIKQGTYVCLVCTEEVDDESEVWSCGFCHRVYDLECIESWAKKDSQNDKENKWRCPSCNGKSLEIPSTYTCWCGKVINPARNMFAPHSCGQTCSEPLGTCPHTCPLSCHPGPHSTTCQALPQLRCDCGAQTKQFPCIIAPYKENWKCDTICEQIMPCGIHKHNLICHSNLCGPCNELVEATCYCGAHHDQIPCHTGKPINCSIATDDGTIKSWIGSYQCNSERCDKILDCNNKTHKCEIPYCHPQTATDVHSKFYHRCALNPQLLKTCPCGKSAITDLLGGRNRQSCSDPVPTCDKPCGKILDCGHKCYWPCHTGNEHARCFESVEMSCNCSYSKFLVPCAFVQSGKVPKCKRKCQALKSCRRHRCGNVCCSMEKTAAKRERDRKKNNYKRSQDQIENTSPTPNRDSDIEAVHICLEPCNKLLGCKRHRCQWQDHPGKCPPCLESSFDDLICACGKTVLIDAPVRCGAVPTRKCQYQCTRETACGHQMPHQCHQDNVQCPKCTTIVSKECACGKRTINGVYCYQDRVSCGTKCDRLLRCQHECPRICCLKDDNHLSVKCTATCNKPRDNSCGHPDLTKCHWPKPCNEEIPCKMQIKLHCECKRRTKVLECQATTTRPSKTTQPLECDAECFRIKRNQRLFAALNLDQQSSSPANSSGLSSAAQQHLFANPYSDYIIDVYIKQKKWCQQIENIFKDLVGKWQEDKISAKKSYNFAPMRKPQRTFIHHLSDVYGLFSQSYDPEPRRSVRVAITQNSIIPPVMLSEALSSTESLKARRAYELELYEVGAAEYNAIIVSECRHGITVNELEECIAPIFNQSALSYSSSSQDFGKKPLPVVKWTSDLSYLVLPPNFETFTKKQELELYVVAAKFESLAKSKGVAQTARVCKVDFNGEIILKYAAENNSNIFDINKEKIPDTEKVVEKLNDLKIEKSTISNINYDDKNITDWL